MVFIEGSKVEVWNRREAPSGSWWRAEIVSFNGDTYSVRYDGNPESSSTVVERVPRKAIRPCPPLWGGLQHLMTGDVVEVFENNSWKLAEVLEVVDRSYCDVRLGSYRFRAHKSHIRMRMSWQGNRWVAISKDSGNFNRVMLNTKSRERKFDNSLTRLRLDMDSFAGKNSSPIESHEFFKESGNIMKRSHGIHVEKSFDGRRKMRAIEKNGRRERIDAQCSTQRLKEVDVPFPGLVLGKKCMHSSFNNRTTASTNMEIGRDISSFGEQKHLLRCSEPSHAESTSSSVGSCSASSSPCRSMQHSVTYKSKAFYTQSDRVETGKLETESSLPRQELQGEIHQLELNAYRSTLIALYASGPISWEQEALLTDLRLALNISSDEHLVELKNLLHS